MYCIRKIKGIPVLEAWFCQPEPEIESKYLLHYYKQILSPIEINKGQHVIYDQTFTTLVNDLSQSEEEFLNLCEKNTRNEIRRAKRDGAACRFYTSNDLRGEDKLLLRFDAAYMEMYKKKEMSVSSRYRYMRTLIQADMMALTCCEYGGETVAFHVYIAADGIARLLYSVSQFRDTADDDTSLRNAIGRCNRFLHFEDMLWFKRQGFQTYDWGGISDRAELEGIDRFKKHFGGERREHHNALISRSRCLKMAVQAREKLKTRKLSEGSNALEGRAK